MAVCGLSILLAVFGILSMDRQLTLLLSNLATLGTSTRQAPNGQPPNGTNLVEILRRYHHDPFDNRCVPS